MPDRERIAAFIGSLDPGLPGWLADVEAEALRDGVPVIRKETQQLLRFLVSLHRPERILEVGCGTGFSALLMWDAGDRLPKIDTIENYEPRIRKAKENLEHYSDGSVRLLEGDAHELLPGLKEPYDMIFMDAAKGQYPAFLPEVLRLLVPGGLLVTDNVLREGDILESRFAVRRRDRTIHKRMRGYLYELMHAPGLVSTILPGGDGAALSVKKKENS
ncbi:MAG: O-methyltransferase [Lachnospiraceae bacterium]|nr:O-methyltransferase [Lachnospiraceae bacterium]